jgi:hypothetical protein
MNVHDHTKLDATLAEPPWEHGLGVGAALRGIPLPREKRHCERH